MINIKQILKNLLNTHTHDIISFKESMDLTELPVITFMNNGKKLNFLLDSGSNESIINKSILPQLDYKDSGLYSEMIGVEGSKMILNKCLMVISYKDNMFESLFQIADLNKPFTCIKKESGVQLHGILGSLFFQKYNYLLDFEHLTIHVKK